MKGTDLTPEQLEAAERFILSIRSEGNSSQGGGTILQRWEDFVRVVAWYGALRYESGRKGLGFGISDEETNPIVNPSPLL